MKRSMERAKTFKRLMAYLIEEPSHAICSEEEFTRRELNYLERMAANDYVWTDRDEDGVTFWVLRPFVCMYFEEKYRKERACST